MCLLTEIHSCSSDNPDKQNNGSENGKTKKQYCHFYCILLTKTNVCTVTLKYIVVCSKLNQSHIFRAFNYESEKVCQAVWVRVQPEKTKHFNPLNSAAEMVLQGLQSKLNCVENIQAHTVRKERFSCGKKRERCIRSTRMSEVIIILKNPNLNIRSAAGRSPPRHSAFWRKYQGCIQLCPDDLQPHCLLGARCLPAPPEQLGRQYFISMIIMVSIQVKTLCVYI